MRDDCYYIYYRHRKDSDCIINRRIDDYYGGYDLIG